MSIRNIILYIKTVLKTMKFQYIKTIKGNCIFMVKMQEEPNFL